MPCLDRFDGQKLDNTMHVKFVNILNFCKNRSDILVESLKGLTLLQWSKR